ncbi:MAG TPA: nucleotidyltransferase family protein [Pyrinomonadaceae bacterium]
MVQDKQRRSKGKLVAAALAGSWRSSSAPLDLTEAELNEVTPLLFGSGAAALGWWRVRHTALRDTPSGEVLQQGYRLQSLQATIQEQNIKKIFRLLRQAGVEPVLGKGWAAANLYPDRALRAYGDIDLLVRPADVARAGKVVQSEEASDCWVDLHSSFWELSDRSVDKLFERSCLLDLDGDQIRVLSNEDHLTLLSIHLLKHGAWRPLWLCDIGAALESLPGTFDWSVCLGSKQKRAGWILVAVGLASVLLDARANQLPFSSTEQRLPQWLTASVLKEWDQPVAGNQPPMSHPRPMSSFLRHPAGLWDGLRQRWPNPILATVSVNGSFTDAPRLPYQVGNCLLRTGLFFRELPARLQSRQ